MNVTLFMQGGEIGGTLASDVAEKVTALVEAAERSCEGTLTRITVDVQSSGEFPFRLEHSGDQHPDVGCAYVREVSHPTPANRSTGAVTHSKATNRG